MGIDTQNLKKYNEKYSNFEKVLSEDSKKIFIELIQIFKNYGLDTNKDIDVVAMIGRWQKDEKSLNIFQSKNSTLKVGLDNLIEELEEKNIYLNINLYKAMTLKVVETHSDTDRFNMGDN